MIGRHHLSHGDVESLSTFLLRLYAVTDLQDFRTTLVQGLRQLVPADRCSFNYIDAMTTEPAWVADGLDYPMNAQIFAAHIREHPIPVHVRRTGAPGCFRLSDLTTRQAFRGSPLYACWYKPLGIEHQLITLVRGAGPRFVAVALSRNGRLDFSDRDSAIGTVLVPHLIGSYRAALRASEAEREIGLLSQGLESVKTGVILLSEDGRMMLGTPLARRWLEKYFGTPKHDSTRLPEPLHDWVARSNGCGNPTETVSRPRSPLVMEVEDRRLAIDLVGDRRHLALLLSEQFVEIPAKMLEALGLTPRETEVLKWVAEGKRDGEIAIILGLSSRTVSHHLERIYRKLSVETRTAAAARAREVVSLAATQ